MKKNVTFVLDEDVIKKLEIFRAERTRNRGVKVSLSDLLNEFLDSAL